MRYARTSRSNCDAVCTNACSNRVDSGTRSATLVAARTFEYDNRPAANAASNNGNPVNADATRTYSRAAPGATEHAHANQCAHDLIPHSAHPLRRSNSATNRNHSPVDAANRPAKEQIRDSKTSSGTAPGASTGITGTTRNSWAGAAGRERRFGALCHINDRSPSPMSSSPSMPSSPVWKPIICHPLTSIEHTVRE